MSSLTSVQVTRFCQYIQFPSILQSDENVLDIFYIKECELHCHAKPERYDGYWLCVFVMLLSTLCNWFRGLPSFIFYFVFCILYFQGGFGVYWIVCIFNAVKHIMQLVQRLPIFYILTAPLHPLANIKGRGGRFWRQQKIFNFCPEGSWEKKFVFRFC